MHKSTLFTGQPIFAQLLGLIPQTLINKFTRKYNSDRYCKKFMSYDHFVTMLYASFFQCASLREVTTGMQANVFKLQHLGLEHTPRRSTLSEANQRRSADWFGDLYHALYDLYFGGLPDSRRKEDRLFIIDSTTISLFSSIMQGAGSYKSNGKKKGGAKAHVMLDAHHDIPAFIDISEAKEHDLTFLNKLQVPDGAIVVMDKAYVKHSQFEEWDSRGVRWVTRQKDDASVQIIERLDVPEEAAQGGVLEDNIILLGRPSNKKVTPVLRVRQVVYLDKNTNNAYIFITNDFTSTAQQIADIYKQRWQIELLFKRIKRCYPLKYFLGDNPNAVKIQIWSALICDLLIRIVQQQVKTKQNKSWAYATLSGMIRHHLMQYLHLTEFLRNPEKALLNYKPPDNALQLKMFG